MEPRYPYPPKHRRPFPAPPPHDDNLNSTSSSSSSSSSSDQHLPHQHNSSPEILLKRRRLHPYDHPPPYQYNPRAAVPVEWSKQSTFALIDAWGHRFLSNGRRNLHPHQWSQLVRLLNDLSGTTYSEQDCRNRIEVLKNRYDNEKARLFRSPSTTTSTSKWPYFAKLHQFMGPDPSQRTRERERDMPKLTFGTDNGHFVSGQGPPDTGSEGDDDYDASDAMHDDAVNGNGLSSYGVLAHSVKKFGEVCQRMETNRKRQAKELETLRREFQMDLQSRKREIFKRVQNELAKADKGYDDGMHGESGDGMDDEDGDDDMDDDDDGDGEFGGNLSD